MFQRCLECQEEYIVNINTNTCQMICENDFKNPLANFCMPCLHENCLEINPTKLELLREDPETYNIVPTRQISTSDYQKFIKAEILDVNSDDYTIKMFMDGNRVKLRVYPETNIVNKKLNIESVDNSIFDANRNEIDHLFSQRETIFIRSLCVDKNSWGRWLAYGVLLLFTVSFLLLVVFTGVMFN